MDGPTGIGDGDVVEPGEESSGSGPEADAAPPPSGDLPGASVPPAEPADADVHGGTVPSPGGRSSSTVAVLAVLLTLAVVVLVAGVAYVVTKKSGHELTGSITVLDEDYLGRSPGGSCSPSGGYGDIDSGSQVTVEDQAGTTLAVGKLGSGTYVDMLADLDPSTTTSRPSTASDLTFVGCRLSISVADVPDADFYRVQIGRRDPYEISRADLEADGWTIELSLGDPI